MPPLFLIKISINSHLYCIFKLIYFLRLWNIKKIEKLAFCVALWKNVSLYKFPKDLKKNEKCNMICWYIISNKWIVLNDTIHTGRKKI